MKRLFLLWLVVPLIAFGYPLTPDLAETPGEQCTESNSDFIEYRYDEQIPYCERNVSSSLKAAIYDDYGIPKTERHEYTIDHLIPLSIGGTNSRKNLWPEHRKVKALRPGLEMFLFTSLRDGLITQAEAVAIILDAKAGPCEYQGEGSNIHGSDACERALGEKPSVVPVVPETAPFCSRRTR